MPFLDIVVHRSWVFLPHVLSPSTPPYGTGEGLTLEFSRSINRGASSNSMVMKFSNQLGTHVDAPRTSSLTGKTLISIGPTSGYFQKYLVPM